MLLMSKIKKILLVIAFSLTSSLVIAAESIVASVNGMVCIECQKKVIKSLKALSSGAEIKVLVSWPEGVAVLSFEDKATIDNETVKKAITHSGFEVVKIVKVQEIVDDPKAAEKAVN